MHRRPEAELLPLGTEIERTLQNLRRITSAKSRNMENQRERLQTIPEEEEVERPQRPNIMEEFWWPIIQEEYSTVRQPPIEANNFELKPTLITMAQQHQFISHPSEDPNENIGRFMRMANTVKLNGVRLDVIKLQLFPFSLRDVAATWFDSIIQLNLPQEMKEEILVKAKIENLKTKIYLMVITLDLNLVNNNIDNNFQEAYNQEKDLSEIFYSNLNKMEIPTYEDFENLDNE